MKRKILACISLLLCLALSLELAACSGLPLRPSGGGETAAPAEESAEPANAGGWSGLFGPRETEPTPEPTPVPVYLPLSINEVMASNKSTLADGALFPDWVELYNYGSEAVSLGGLYLCCDGVRWALPDETLAADGYKLVFCDGSGSDGSHASFTVEKDGAALSLETGDGYVLERFDAPQAEADYSYYRNDEGQVVSTAFPSPGFDNSREGYISWQSSRTGGALQIYEVMVYNEWYLPQGGNYYDWVEIKNVSDQAVDLGGYYLSDSGSERTRYAFPSRSLGPGEIFTVYCTGDETVTGAAFAPFALSAQRDQLYLSAPDGSLADYVCLHDIPYKGSFGRLDGQNGFFYFAAPTPGVGNGGGARTIAAKPRLLGSDGAFNDVESVTGTLEAEGEIRYTLDGSTPTSSSALYTEPLVLTETKVVRAIHIHPGELTSESLDLSFFINENHTLPIVSLVSEPSNLFGGNGLYSNPGREIERPGSVTLYETDGTGFTIDCGIKLHGATSKLAQSKKSFKLCFRSRYDGELHYDLFENGVTDFASILLRAAQESTYSTYMRDNIMHQLAIQCFPALPAQDYKYSVLYINGKYWGVYNIREAHSVTHYANHYGYSEESISHWKEKWPADSPIAEIYRYALNHSLSSDTYYNEVAARINVDSVIGWAILQAYSGNVDFYPPNTRFYYSTEDGQMRYALVDLDLGMFAYNMFDPVENFGYAYNTLFKRLLANKQFQLRMAELLSEALRGPMSDENVLALIDRLADELRPEMDRDRKRWARGNASQDCVEGWDSGWGDAALPYLRDFVTRKGGRAYLLMNSFHNRQSLSLTTDEWTQYFGDIVYQSHDN